MAAIRLVRQVGVHVSYKLNALLAASNKLASDPMEIIRSLPNALNTLTSKIV